MSTRRLENAHVALWLLKDYSWCTSTRWLGLLMALPTIALAVMIAKESWKNVEDFVHNAAVCCWIAANITWMVGEFYFEDHTRHYAQGFFYAGMALVALYYLWLGVERLFARGRWSFATAGDSIAIIAHDRFAGRITDEEAEQRVAEIVARLRRSGS